MCLPCNIDKANCKEEIALWRNKYENLLNCVTNEDKKCFVENALNGDSPPQEPVISVDTLHDIIINLKRNKSPGPDGISAEHLVYAPLAVLYHLSICINALFFHCFLPKNLLSVILTPVVKNKSGDISSSVNYRPIALATIGSKIVEKVILLNCEPLLYTSDYQFGFKTGSSTDQCIYVLKEVINLYCSQGGPTFVCFLDASKAFDRVNHWTLLEKLIKRNVPLYIVKLLYVWCRNQKFSVKWGSCLSEPFYAGNGVRQRGILSPSLFAIYVHDLDISSTKAKTGCNVGGCFINHLFYPDDLCLICPSTRSLQCLLDICTTYASAHDILFNAKKSACIVAKPVLEILKILKYPFVANCSPTISSIPT